MVVLQTYVFFLIGKTFGAVLLRRKLLLSRFQTVSVRLKMYALYLREFRWHLEISARRLEIPKRRVEIFRRRLDFAATNCRKSGCFCCAPKALRAFKMDALRIWRNWAEIRVGAEDFSAHLMSKCV